MSGKGGAMTNERRVAGIRAQVESGEVFEFPEEEDFRAVFAALDAAEAERDEAQRQWAILSKMMTQETELLREAEAERVALRAQVETLTQERDELRRGYDGLVDLVDRRQTALTAAQAQVRRAAHWTEHGPKLQAENAALRAQVEALTQEREDANHEIAWIAKSRDEAKLSAAHWLEHGPKLREAVLQLKTQATDYDDLQRRVDELEAALADSEEPKP